MKSRCAIVLPVYNEEAVLPIMVNALGETFAKERYDILIVDDGSSDGTWGIVKNLAKTRDNIGGLRFTRNFGKESAIGAGLRKAYDMVDSVACVIVMDADMQHPVDIALKMYKSWSRGGVDIIEGVKTARQNESPLRRYGAKLFYKALQTMAGLNLENASDFKLLDVRVVREIINMPENQTFFRAMTGWTGLRAQKIYFEPKERSAGGTKWSLIKLARLAIGSVTAYTSKPLNWVTFAGFGFLAFALLLALQTLINYVLGYSVAGFTTVIILLLLIGSVLMISLGIIGVYIAKIYDEIKARPRYIISEALEIRGQKD
ncbi:MAG: glycosyltransferase family 2 protein [Clostridiales bacterium]|jgi:dolichol-phosphate mannosyltransferase|nr:glycosyltransferase family 2 protein [Clostridiales bacterium]